MLSVGVDCAAKSSLTERIAASCRLAVGASGSLAVAPAILYRLVSAIHLSGEDAPPLRVVLATVTPQPIYLSMSVIYK